MATKHFCDLCGSEVDPLKAYPAGKKMSFRLQVWSEDGDRDLCPLCALEALQAWIHERRKA